MERYRKRTEKVRAEMGRAGISQLLINDPLSIYYLTGLEVSPGERFWALLLCPGDRQVLFANRLFALGDTGMETVMMTDSDSAAEKLLPFLEDAPLGVDKNLPARFLLPVMDRFGGPVKLGSDCVDEVRACKDEAERELMRRASKINDACIQKVAAFIHDGVTEKECSEYLDRCYAEYEVDGLSFESIISFGANAADPHHRADRTVLREGDCIVIDIGCRKDRYCSDMTRTYFWKKADPRYLAIHDLVREANEKAEALVRPGVRLCDIDAAARDHIAAAGYGPNFTHRLGHFIGMEDHEKGDVSQASTAEVREGMVFSIEPGVYLPGEFGVRIEDLVLVTRNGCELLNHVDKRAVILGV